MLWVEFGFSEEAGCSIFRSVRGRGPAVVVLLRTVSDARDTPGAYHYRTSSWSEKMASPGLAL